MNLDDLQSAEWRARAAARMGKRIRGLARRASEKRPVFIAGLQRSGTTMLMNIFHLHPDTDVFDESLRSKVFSDFRIRSRDVLKRSVETTGFPFPCYKIISDSHLLRTFLDDFATARVIWMYREAAPNAESQLKKWPHATEAIRAVCEGRSGGGWFAEGVSPAVRERLRALDRSRFGEYDWACLSWWARNMLFEEQRLEGEPRVRLLRYETLASDPSATMRRLYDWLGMRWFAPSMRFVHARSVRKRDLPALDPQVQRLCDDLLQRFDRTHKAQWQL